YWLAWDERTAGSTASASASTPSGGWTATRRTSCRRICAAARPAAPSWRSCAASPSCSPAASRTRPRPRPAARARGRRDEKAPAADRGPAPPCRGSAAPAPTAPEDQGGDGDGGPDARQQHALVDPALGVVVLAAGAARRPAERPGDVARLLFQPVGAPPRDVPRVDPVDDLVDRAREFLDVALDVPFQRLRVAGPVRHAVSYRSGRKHDQRSLIRPVWQVSPRNARRTPGPVPLEAAYERKAGQGVRAAAAGRRRPRFRASRRGRVAGVAGLAARQARDPLLLPGRGDAGLHQGVGRLPEQPRRAGGRGRR